MRSNYKKLGPYIRQVSVKNKDLEVQTLLGVSITKAFIPSIANTVGTNMSTYKVVQKGQFAYGPVTSRNGDKISVALLTEPSCIISTSYTVFEIIDRNELDPEYLMMWFRRPEFDRYARYMSHGSVREIFGWEEMCDVELPVPHIDKQREIVREYNVIVDRIKLNEQLCSKLEDTAQTLYKHWFVDFEFPMSKEYAASISKPELEGKPYKSNGGAMKYCEELEKDIPVNWTLDRIKNFCSDMKSGGTPNRGAEEYWNSKDVPWLKTGEVANCVLVDAEEYISREGLKNSSAKLLPKNTVLMAMYGDGKTKGQVGFLRFEATTNQACCAMICDDVNQATYLYFYLFVNYQEIVNMANGGAQDNLSKKLIEELPVLVPTDDLFDRHAFKEAINHSEAQVRETRALYEMCETLLQRLSTTEELAA